MGLTQIDSRQVGGEVARIGRFAEVRICVHEKDTRTHTHLHTHTHICAKWKVKLRVLAVSLRCVYVC